MLDHEAMPLREAQRQSALQILRQHSDSRRSFLKKAAAAGLIPVISAETVMARRASAQEPVQGGSIVVLGHHPVDTLSPDNDGETVMWSVCAQLFDAMYFVNGMLELEPSVATDFEVSEDGLSYTFTLHEGVTFHNGDSLTSEDVKYTYDWIMNPDNASTRSGDFGLVESVEAPDPTTVVINLTEPDASFMVNVPTTFIYPASYHAEIGEEAFTAEPVGSGPFQLTEWIPAQSTTLERFDDYIHGPANFDTFRIDIVPEAAGRAAALETGQADHSVWALNTEDNVTLEESGEFAVFRTTSRSTNHFALNHQRPVLADRAVRRAMLHAADRQAIADEIYGGQAVIATANISPALETFYNPDVPTYDFNPETARSILDEAGWVVGDDGIREKDGERLAFTLMMIQGDTQRRPIGELAQQWFADVGIEMSLEETVSVVDGLFDGSHDAGLFNWTYGGNNGEPDCRDTLSTEGANNFNHYSNEELDQLLMDGVRELEQEQRVEIYNRVQEIVAEEVPYLFFVHPQGYLFFNDRIKGLPESVMNQEGMYHKVRTFWAEEA